jgi:hypothetical protein
MKKAILVNLEDKSAKRYKTAALQSPHERLEYLFELIKLSKRFVSDKPKIATDTSLVYILSRKIDVHI